MILRKNRQQSLDRYAVCLDVALDHARIHLEGRSRRCRPVACVQSGIGNLYVRLAGEDVEIVEEGDAEAPRVRLAEASDQLGQRRHGRPVGGCKSFQRSGHRRVRVAALERQAQPAL